MERPTTIPPSLVPDVLREYGELTRAALERYLPAVEPRRYLYDLVADYPRRGGKGMRPSLCLATARAFGARTEEALGAAVAIELFHNALLVHDDIQDESEERRGGPALHVLHGVPLALNAGDSLVLLSLRPLLENRLQLGQRLTLRIIELTERMARESSEGQALELGWRHDNVIDLSDEDYLEMVLKKTCWLGTIYPLQVGALIGTRNGASLDPFLRFGFFLGAAFQIRDDVLNLIGDHRYGKEIDGDIWEGKRSLMMVHLLREAAPHERDRLADFLARSRAGRNEGEVRWVRGLMDRYGSIEYAQDLAGGLAGAALHEHALAYGGLPASRDRLFT
ncbi:MAG TPA: polyprenyl synthetase family protein, partial [Thermoanaerobaculia bacterium]|nr:polyprenyl synthetase family protein [Thermoanaerobaculia bacterium]